MFTALVLVCSATTVDYSADTCYTVMNKALSDTYDECVYAIQNAYKEKVFDYWDGDTGEPWRPVDYQCISWNNAKV